MENASSSDTLLTRVNRLAHGDVLGFNILGHLDRGKLCPPREDRLSFLLFSCLVSRVYRLVSEDALIDSKNDDNILLGLDVTCLHLTNKIGI